MLLALNSFSGEDRLIGVFCSRVRIYRVEEKTVYEPDEIMERAY